MKKNGDMFKNLALISQLGISMMVPVFLGVGIGLLIDKHFHTMFSILGLLLGIISGYRNTYLIVKGAMDKAKDSAKTEEQLADEEAVRKLKEMYDNPAGMTRRGGVYRNVNKDANDLDNQSKGE